jgi:subtilisin family serine protease
MRRHIQITLLILMSALATGCTGDAKDTLNNAVSRIQDAGERLLDAVGTAAKNFVPEGSEGIFSGTPAIRILNPAEELIEFDPAGILRWSMASGADAYEVWAYRDSSMTQLQEFSAALTSRQYQFTKLLAGQTYHIKIYFRVNGSWQELPLFTLSTTTEVVKPRLSNPQDELDGFGQGGVLRWSAVNGADIYEVWFYRDAALTAFAETSGPVRITQYQPATLKTGTTYYVQVYARVNGVFKVGGPLTLTMGAQINKARILNPQEELDAFAVDGLLRWSPVTGATSYELWIFTNPNSSETQEGSGPLTSRAYSPRTLQPGRVYYAQAYSKVNGVWQVGAPVRITTTTTPSRSRLTNPQEELESFRVGDTLRWSAISGATAYEVWIYGNAGLGTIIESGSAGSRSFQPTKLCVGGTYHVQVYALVAGQWTTGWATRLDVTQGTSAADCSPPAPKITLTASVDEVFGGESATLTWATQFADSCTASNGWSGTKSANGSETVGPLNAATLFTLTCNGKGGAYKAETFVTIRSGSGISMNGIALSLNVVGFSTSTVTGNLVASVAGGGAATYSIQSQGQYGNATVNASTGAFSYSIADLPASATATTDRVVVAATSGLRTTTASVDITLRFDPLLPNQWHMRNTGQIAFSSTPPVGGFDINIGPAWAAGFSGNGVRIAVVDSGLEVAHEDLRDNVDVLKSVNFTTSTNDTTATGPSDHGTMVAGIISATAFNAKGGRGIAYRARLRGYNVIAAPGLQTVGNLSTALGGAAISADNDIFNQSFGVGASAVNKSLQSFNSFSGELNYLITTLRGGLGAIGIQAAGNEFETQNGDASTCGYANYFGISCGHVATDTRRASTYPIIVGATSAEGKKASYSTTGASIWISAPGGEYGYSSGYDSSLSPAKYKPAIVTTTSTGCGNYSLSFNTLDSRGANALAAQCQYTAMMNGTSSAAPVVSGVVALMLEANPQLTWRDVRHILATTARKVDESFVPIAFTGLLSSGALTLEQGWVRNAAGFHFHNWYGFGKVDAARAVTAARNYTSYLPPRADSPPFILRPTQPIIVAPTSSFSFTANVTSGLSVIEGVVLYMNFDTPGLYCNQVEITSPTGTKSILLNGGAGFNQTQVRDSRLASNAFYGESSLGIWRVTYHNICGASIGSTVLPTGLDQTLLFVGY